MGRKASRPNHQILEEASTWFAAFRSQELAATARQEFQEWLKRSPEHISAYLQIASIYADLPAPEDGRTPPELIERAKASADINVHSLNPARRPQAVQPTWLSRLFSDRWVLVSRITVAASVLMFAGVGGWLYLDRNTYRTDIGEQRSITLSDGSIVELNARSKVRIAFRDEQRDIELLEGQALFRVAKDQRRPFIVEAGATSVRAVGTQFDVYRKSTGTTVTVVEGRVAVLSAIDQAVMQSQMRETPVPIPVTQALLVAGEQMTVTPSGAQRVERPNVAAATAWTQHQLVFDGTPLSEVLEEFSRYTTRRLIIDTPELAHLQISGQYTSNSPDSLLRFLSLQKGVVVTEVDGDAHIRRE
jgi:transmembrane sensor